LLNLSSSIKLLSKIELSIFRVQETNGTVRAVTQLVVSQIKTRNGTEGQEETKRTFGTPAQLVFVTEEVGVYIQNNILIIVFTMWMQLANAKRPRCAFWNFTER